MTTYPYELLDTPPAEIAAGICADHGSARELPDATLKAMLSWAQHEQNHAVYETCYALIDPGDDGEPCFTCGAWLPWHVQAAAIDGATVCVPCGTARYGDTLSQYLIGGPPDAA